MGKKKSVALIIVVTVVLAGLIFMSVASFPVSAVDSYKPLFSLVRLGTDLGGGYTTVYYPEGVISQDEYNKLVAEYDETKGTEDETDDPSKSYAKHEGVYLSEDICNIKTKEVYDSFKDNFDSAFRALKYRFEHKNFIDYSIKLQDDYTIRVEVPEIDDASSILETLSYGGSLYFSDSAESVTTKNVLMSGDAENVKSAKAVDLGDEYGYGVAVNFTAEGQENFRKMTADLISAASESSDSSSSGTVSAQFYVYVGSNLLSTVSISSEMNQPAMYIYNENSPMSADTAEAMASVIGSTLDENNVFDLKLTNPHVDRLLPTMGEHAALIALCVLGGLALAMIVYSLVRYKGIGLAHTYGFLTYAAVLTLCVTLIGAVQINAAGLIAVALSAAVMVGFNFYAFKNIRNEFATGKTLTNAVRAGFNKSLALTIDVHAVLVLVSAALYFIATGTVQFMALIFLLGTLVSAACTLAVTRFYLYMFLAQPKNKIAFCNFKREETEDE